MKKRKYVVWIFIMVTSFTFGQQKLLGKILDNNKQPIENAKIYLDTIDVEIVSNAKGYFEVVVPTDVKEIHVYSEKYGLLSTPNKQEKRITFMYVEEKESINGNKKVDIGYREVEKSNLPFKVANLNVEEDVNSTSFNNIYEYIDGRLSGVRVINNNQIVVRGTNTMTGSTDPLFVVDGVIVYDISFVNPNEVKRLDLLNGAAASIYGSESANGVIQIITK